MNRQKDPKALKALVHNVMLNERGWLLKVIEAWVETAFFYETNFEFTSVEAVFRFISAEFKLQFHQIEIQQAIDSLTGKSIVKTPEGWKLTDQRASEIYEEIQKDEQLAARVKEEWFEQLRSRYPAIGTSGIEPLWGELIDGFLGPLFLRLEVAPSLGQERGNIKSGSRCPQFRATASMGRAAR